MSLDASGHLEMQEQQADALMDLLLSTAAIKLNEFMICTMLLGFLPQLY